jgi:hypothetical protein
MNEKEIFLAAVVKSSRSEQCAYARQPILRKALITYDNKMPASCQYYSAVSALGACLSDQAKYSDAEDLLLESQDGLEMNFQKQRDPR